MRQPTALHDLMYKTRASNPEIANSNPAWSTFIAFELRPRHHNANIRPSVVALSFDPDAVNFGNATQFAPPKRFTNDVITAPFSCSSGLMDKASDF